MALVWIVGVHIVRSAGSTAMKIRNGDLPDIASVLRSGAGDATNPIAQLIVDARLFVLGQMADLAFPLQLGKALLATTLVLSATLVLLGRPGSRSFALQALFANAVFSIVEYVLLRHARGAWIEMAMRAAASIRDPLLPLDPVELARLQGYIFERAHLVLLELLIPFLGAIALTRPRTKIYFAEVAAAAESAEEEP